MAGEAIAMVDPTWLPDVEVGARWLLGFVFAVSAVAKLRDLRTFADELRQYPLPASIQARIKFSLPALEALIAVLLLTGTFARLAAVAAAILLVIFTSLALWAAITARQLRCACFGSSHNEAMGLSVIVRDVVLLGCGLFVGVGPSDILTVDSLLGVTRPGHLALSDGIPIGIVVSLVIICHAHMRRAFGMGQSFVSSTMTVAASQVK
jgi:uncharacterized membrane protein YphA (DoxX/SURF4 family)